MKVDRDPWRARMHRMARSEILGIGYRRANTRDAYHQYMQYRNEQLRLRKNYYIPDPVTGEVRYIGSTARSLESRLRGHIRAAQPTPFIRWLTSVLDRGFTPEIIGWDEPLLEEELIRECSKHGDLLNVAYNTRPPQRIHEHAIQSYYDDLVSSISGAWKG